MHISCFYSQRLILSLITKIRLSGSDRFTLIYNYLTNGVCQYDSANHSIISLKFKKKSIFDALVKNRKISQGFPLKKIIQNFEKKFYVFHVCLVNILI